MRNLFLLYLYLSISKCFGRLWAHHQEQQLCFCDNWYLLFCVDDSLVCLQAYQTVVSPDDGPIVALVSGDYGSIIRRNNCVFATIVTCYSVWMTVWCACRHTRQSSSQNNKYQLSRNHSCFSWWWAHSRLKHVRLWAHHQGKQLSGMPAGIPDCHPHRITSTNCRKNTVVSPDDGPIAARNI